MKGDIMPKSHFHGLELLDALVAGLMSEAHFGTDIELLIILVM